MNKLKYTLMRISFSFKTAFFIFILSIIASFFLGTALDIVVFKSTGGMVGFWGHLKEGIKYLVVGEELSTQHLFLIITALSPLFVMLFVFLVAMEFFSLKEKTISGPELVKLNLPDFNKEISANKQPGLKIYENFSLPRIAETNHFFIAGSPGSGKTQLLFPFIEAARAAGDKVIIYDNKGDFTESLVWNENTYLMAPWDTRGVRWDLGGDITNRQLAREFANRMILESEEPLYSNSARLILYGVICFLQDNYPKKWTVSDLISTMSKSREELVQILKECAPEVVEMIREPSKLTQNIFTNLIASLSNISDLKMAWDSVEKGISIRSLIQNEKPFTLVLQGSGLYRNMAESLHKSIIGSLAAEIESLPDSKSRRIWFFLDEFPQIGNIPGIIPMLEIGRSKGVGVVIAIQNFDQLVSRYGESEANSIMSMCQTHFYCRTAIGTTCNRIVENIGKKEIERLEPVFDAKMNITAWNNVRQTKPVISTDFLSTGIGVQKDGITLLCAGLTKNITEIKIPFFDKKIYRKKNEWANWAKS